MSPTGFGVCEQTNGMEQSLSHNCILAILLCFALFSSGLKYPLVYSRASAYCFLANDLLTFHILYLYTQDCTTASTVKTRMQCLARCFLTFKCTEEQKEKWQNSRAQLQKSSEWGSFFSKQPQQTFVCKTLQWLGNNKILPILLYFCNSPKNILHVLIFAQGTDVYKFRAYCALDTQLLVSYSTPP